MISLRLDILDERAGRPTGNPFRVRSVVFPKLEIDAGAALVPVKTGIKFVIPSDVDLRIRSIVNGLHVVSWNMDERVGGQLELVVVNISEDAMTLEAGRPVASVEFVEKKSLSVRFMEFRGKSRVITGDAQKVDPHGKGSGQV